MNQPKFSIPIVASLVVVAALGLTAGQAADTHVHTIDAAHSTLTVSVFKEGIFAFAADNHTIDAPIASGWYNDDSKSVDVTVNATKMLVLDPSMPPGRRAQVQANMTGPQVLDAARYPLIEFRSTSIATADGNNLKVTGDLTLHGQTHPITFAVTQVDATHFHGAVTVRQSTFGITPIRIAAGTVRVKDDVKLEFHIALSSAS